MRKPPCQNNFACPMNLEDKGCEYPEGECKILKDLDDPCPTCGEPLESHGSGERFPCLDGRGYFVDMEDGE
jgi:hypothetical protein